MLAIILATDIAGRLGRHDRTSPYMLRLGDRPFVQHVIESLVLRGITQFEFIFSDSSAAAETYLGDGSRWGCKFSFHVLSKAGLKPLLRDIAAPEFGSILMGRADRLPAFSALGIQAWENTVQTIFFTSRNEQAPRGYVWTDWAVFADRHGLAEHLDRNTEVALLLSGAAVRLGSAPEHRLIEHEFSVRSGEATLRTQQDLFSGHYPDLQVGGRQVKEGVWMGRNVALHPSATLNAPVYLGANSRICAHAHVGPFTVVGENCIIGADSTICHSLISPGSYVGESLEIQQSIVDHEQLMDVKAGTSYRATDKFLLGSLVGTRQVNFVRRAIERVAAAILLVLFLPVIAIAFLITKRQRTAVVSDHAIRIPNDPEPYKWKSFSIYRFDLHSHARRELASHFVSVFLPGLVSVVKGDLSLVGVKPRSAREIALMPEDWRTLYLKTKAGLVTDAVVNFDPHPTEDELRASECYYSATESFTHDLRLMGLYLLKLSKVTLNEQESHLSAQPSHSPLQPHPVPDDCKSV